MPIATLPQVDILPQVDMGHPANMGRKYRSKINKVPHVPHVPQGIRACVRARVTSDERGRSIYYHFYLGQMGHMGQSIEIASLFCAPCLPSKSVNMGHMGQSGRMRVCADDRAGRRADGGTVAAPWVLPRPPSPTGRGDPGISPVIPFRNWPNNRTISIIYLTAVRADE